MNYFNVYWGAVLLLLPLWIRIEKIPVDMRFTKDMFFITSVAMSLILFSERKKIDIKVLSISSFLLFISFYNQWLITSFAVINQWICVSMGILCFIQFHSRLEKKDEEFYLNILSIAAIVQAVLVVLTYIDINLYYYIVKMFNWNANYKIGSSAIPYLGSLGNPMVCSTFLSITTISLLRSKWFFFLPLNLWAVYLTNSATGIISCFFGLATFFIFKYFKSKKTTFSLIGLFIFVGSIFIAFERERFTFLNDNNRFLVWKQSLNLIDGMSILYGKGLGFIADNYSTIYPILGEPFRHLHNEFLEIFFAYGIIGLIILGITLFVMLKRANNIIIISIVVAYLITMITSITLHISATALVGILLVALCLIKGDNHGLNNGDSRTKCH